MKKRRALLPPRGRHPPAIAVAFWTPFSTGLTSTVAVVSLTRRVPNKVSTLKAGARDLKAGA